jgi:hypothetical protein
MANFSQGAQVEHQRFGLGTVISSTDERIVIKFDDHGEKKFVTTMVMGALKKSDRQPPADKKASRSRSKKEPVVKLAPAAKEAVPVEIFESEAFVSEAFAVDPFAPDVFGHVGFDDEIAVDHDELGEDDAFDSIDAVAHATV